MWRLSDRTYIDSFVELNIPNIQDILLLERYTMRDARHIMGELSAQELALLCRVMIERAGAKLNKRITFQDAVRSSEYSKSESPGALPSQSSINRWFSRPPRVLSAEARKTLISAAEYVCELAQIEGDEWSECLDEAIARASMGQFTAKTAVTKSMSIAGDGGRSEIDRLTSFVDILGLQTSDYETDLRAEVFGSYLCFRYSSIIAKIIVSWTTLYAPEKSTEVSRFKTFLVDTGGLGRISSYSGIAMPIQGEPSKLYLAGFDGVNGTPKFEVLTVSPHQAGQSSGGERSQRQELFGIRLALGSFVRDQVAYRVYYAPHSSKHLSEIQNKLGVFTLDELDLSEEVEDVDRILAWITQQGTLSTQNL